MFLHLVTELKSHEAKKWVELQEEIDKYTIKSEISRSFDRCEHIPKCIELYNLNMCSFVNVSYTSIKKF